MPPRCPTCGLEVTDDCLHCPGCGADVFLAKVQEKVRILEGAIAGWRHTDEENKATIGRLTAELDRARAEMAAAIGALQELSIAPEAAGVPFYVADAKGNIEIEPKRVERIFDVLKQTAEKLLPWGKAATESHYAIARLRFINDEMRRALQEIADGGPDKVSAAKYRADGQPSKYDLCRHGKQINHDCGECIAEFARTTLTHLGLAVKRAAKKHDEEKVNAQRGYDQAQLFRERLPPA